MHWGPTHDLWSPQTNTTVVFRPIVQLTTFRIGWQKKVSISPFVFIHLFVNSRHEFLITWMSCSYTSNFNFPVITNSIPACKLSIQCTPQKRLGVSPAIMIGWNFPTLTACGYLVDWLIWIITCIMTNIIVYRVNLGTLSWYCSKIRHWRWSES